MTLPGSPLSSSSPSGTRLRALSTTALTGLAVLAGAPALGAQENAPSLLSLESVLERVETSARERTAIEQSLRSDLGHAHGVRSVSRSVSEWLEDERIPISDEVLSLGQNDLKALVADSGFGYRDSTPYGDFIGRMETGRVTLDDVVFLRSLNARPDFRVIIDADRGTARFHSIDPATGERSARGAAFRVSVGLTVTPGSNTEVAFVVPEGAPASRRLGTAFERIEFAIDESSAMDGALAAVQAETGRTVVMGSDGGARVFVDSDADRNGNQQEQINWAQQQSDRLAAQAVVAEQALVSHAVRLEEQGVRLQAQDERLQAQDARIDGLRGSVSVNRAAVEENRRGIAMAAALHNTYVEPGKRYSLDLNLATFEGEAGLSVGLGGRFLPGWQGHVSMASTMDLDGAVLRGGLNVQW